MKSPTLETPRLLLREFTSDDIPQLVRLAGAREVAATTLRIPYPYYAEHAEKFLAACASRKDFVFAIERREDRQLIGGVGLHPDETHSRAELGYWIGVPYWGNGYATEAARALVRYGFEELKLHRIVAHVFAGNVASDKVLLKIGMRHEGRQRQHVLKWDRFLDQELYGMLRSEYLAD